MVQIVNKPGFAQFKVSSKPILEIQRTKTPISYYSSYNVKEWEAG